MFFNARSITHKTQEINLFTKEKNIDLAIIAESRLQENQESPFYNTLVNIPAKKHLGGILAFSPSGKLKNSIPIISDKNWQIIGFDELIIGFGYFAPSEPFSDIESFFESLEKESEFWQKDVIIVGDFNARHSLSTGDHGNNSRGFKFFELISKYPINLEKSSSGFYTTRTTNGQGITDLLFSASGNKHTVTDFKIHEDNLNGSDHLPLTWSVDIELKPIFRGWNFKLLRSSAVKKLEFQMELQKNHLNIVEEVEKKLVEILIQRQNNSLCNLKNQQKIVNDLWEIIILWLESGLQNTCGRIKNFCVSDILGEKKSEMSSRVRNVKKSIPSDDVLPVTSEDDLLGPGDGNSKIGQKSVKTTRTTDKEVGKSKDGSGSNASDASNDVMETNDRKFIIILEQMHKKDVQIEKLSEAVSC